MINQIKKYGSNTLAWFGVLQFLQPILPNENFKYICYQMSLLAISLVLTLLIALVYRLVQKYIFLSNTQKLKLEICYDDIFNRKYDDYIRVIAADDDLTVDKAKISPKSVYFSFLNRINIATIEDVRMDASRIITLQNDSYVYYLVKIAPFDENDKIVLEDLRYYFSILYDLCEHIENNAKGKKIVCPVLGGRISFQNATPTSSDRLNLMKLAFETYNFKREIDIMIVVNKDNTRPKKYAIV